MKLRTKMYYSEVEDKFLVNIKQIITFAWPSFSSLRVACATVHFAVHLHSSTRVVSTDPCIRVILQLKKTLTKTFDSRIYTGTPPPRKGNPVAPLWNSGEYPAVYPLLKYSGGHRG